MSLLRILSCGIIAGLLLFGCSEPQRPTINLYRAIHIGDLDQIKRHLYWGTEINQAGPDGDYPLHVAARKGRVVIARELLQKGAAVNQANEDGRTPLQVALIAGKTQLARVLVAEGAKDDPQGLLFLLVEAGVSDRDSLEFVVGLGADVDAANEAGARALHRAVANDHLLVVKRLIALGADINATDGEGRTPLAIAASAGRDDIVALLEPFGARLDAGSPGDSP
jgi:ankyrin repeat protein